jgi:hypothetical protein
MLKSYLSDIQAREIDRIIVQLQNSIKPVRIINWINNFEKDEWDMALQVLSFLKYYSVNQIIDEYNEGLKQILSKYYNDKKIFIHGFGELGKSGSTMLYFLKQTPTYRENEDKFKILDHVHKLKSQGLVEGSTIIFLDDIIGSGKSFKTYFIHNIKHQLIKENYTINVLVLCIAYMNGSLDMLKKVDEHIDIFGSGYNKAFASSGSVFGYRPKMLPIREFCFKYGMPLFWTFDNELKKDVPHPLGFNNSQALIIFSHSVPNNTLPIFWSNRKDWYPLYARSGRGKISEAKVFKQENYYWLNLAYKLKILNVDNKEPLIYNAKTNYDLIAVLRLKRQNINTSKIFQTLGLSVNELEVIFTKGRNKGFFDEDDNITEGGKEAIANIERNIKISNSIVKRKLPIFIVPKMYLPKHFKGMT